MKNKKLAKVLVHLMAIGVGALLGVVIASFDFGFLEFFLSAFLGYNIAVIIHEGGHLVFGLLSGYGFSSFRIWSFMILKGDRGVEFKRYKLTGTGGQCLMTPPKGRDEDAPVLLYNLGGVVFNLILSLVCLYFYFAHPDVIILSCTMLLTAVLSAFTLLTNGIPVIIGGMPNDGLNAYVLAKDKASKVAFFNQLRVADAQVRGIRLSDMPDEWFSVPGDVPTKNLFYSTLKVFACNRTLDTLDTVKCEAEIEALLNSNWLIIGLHRALLTIDLIYCRLVNHGRGKDYRYLVTQDVKNVMKSMKKNPAILRTEYAAELLYDGNKAAADKKLCEFDAALKTHPYPGDSELERQLVNLALERYNSNLER